MLATVHGMFRCLPYESPIIVRIHPDDLSYLQQSQPQVSNIINIASANTNCCVDDNIMNIDTTHTHTHSNTDSSDCPTIDNVSPPLAVQGLEYISTNIQKDVQRDIQNTDNIADIVKESIILEETIENIE